MVQFYQTTACVLVAVILILTLRKQGNEIALVLSVLLCCMVGFLAAGFLEPVVRFMQRLQKIGALNQELLNILLKIVGICFTAEIAGLICEDSGNGALGKALQFLASAVILYLSLPLLSKLLDIVEGMLDNL
jgi:stage III sporulation protein AD